MSDKITQKIQQNFERSAKAYAAFEGNQGFFEQLLEELIALIPDSPPRDILDVGCGTGASLPRLLRLAQGGVLGVDNAAAMLAVAQAKHPSAELRVLSAAALGELKPRRFDWIVYNAVFFMLAQGQASLAAALELLRPGGCLLMSNLLDLRVGGQLVAEQVAALTGRPGGRHNLVELDELPNKLHLYFEEIRVKNIKIKLDIDTFRQFYQIEAMSAGLAAYLPYRERKALVDNLAKQWQAQDQKPVQRWQLIAGVKRNSVMAAVPGE